MNENSNDKEDFENFQNNKFDRFEKYFEEFDNLWEEISKKLDPNLIKYLKRNLQKLAYKFSEDFKIQIELVVDTNVLFSQILRILKGKPSFMLGTIDNPFLIVYAPVEIKNEIFNTINKDLPEGFDKREAYNIAEDILSKFSILESTDHQSWKKAYDLIGTQDETDVPFLALAFSIGSHGIISYDRVFEKQNQIKIWDLRECGKIITDITKGSYHFFIFDISLNYIVEPLFSLVLTYGKIILDIFTDLYNAVKIIVEEGVNDFLSLPKWIQFSILVLGIGIPTSLLLFSKKARKKTYDILLNLKNNLKEIIFQLKEKLIVNLKFIYEIIVYLKPFISYSMKGIGYMFYNLSQLLERMDKLEKLKFRDK